MKFVFTFIALLVAGVTLESNAYAQYDGCNEYACYICITEPSERVCVYYDQQTGDHIATIVERLRRPR